MEKTKRKHRDSDQREPAAKESKDRDYQHRHHHDGEESIERKDIDGGAKRVRAVEEQVDSMELLPATASRTSVDFPLSKAKRALQMQKELAEKLKKIPSVNINKQEKDAIQILKPEVDPDENPHFDPMTGIDKDKLLMPKQMSFQCVEEGKWSKDAEIIKSKSHFGEEARTKELKAKQAQFAKTKSEPDINPKVKMSNLMRVLISEATQDHTRLEMEMRIGVYGLKRPHMDRNTPDECPETLVSVYKINNLSHPQTRFKVDANARGNKLTGCAVLSKGISVVVVEGCPKSIKRYRRLMLRRIDWASSVKKDEGEDEAHDAPVNKCFLVWQGNVAKPSFHRFSFEDCQTEAAARKIFSDAGVANYWELAVNFTEDQM